MTTLRRLISCVLGVWSPSLVLLCRVGERAPARASWLHRWEWKIAEVRARELGRIAPWW